MQSILNDDSDMEAAIADVELNLKPHTDNDTADASDAVDVIDLKALADFDARVDDEGEVGAIQTRMTMPAGDIRLNLVSQQSDTENQNQKRSHSQVDVLKRQDTMKLMAYFLGEEPAPAQEQEMLASLLADGDELKVPGECEIVVSIPNEGETEGEVVKRFKPLEDGLRGLSDCLHSTAVSKSPFWLDVLAPTPTLLAKLAKVFPLHPLSQEDAVSLYTREKVEVFKDYLFLALQARDRREDRTPISTCTLYIAIFKNCILSFHPFPVQEVENAIVRIADVDAFEFSIPSPKEDLTTWLPVLLLNQIGESFQDIAASIRAETDTISELVLSVTSAERGEIHLRINQAARCIAKVLRKCTPKKTVLKTLTSRPLKHVSDQSRLLLRDAFDDTIEILNNMQSANENLNTASSFYNNVIMMDMTEASMEMEVSMKKLTAMGGVVLPMTLVASIWGMNIRVPGQDDVSLWWFFGIIVVMIVFGVIVYNLLKRQGWF